MKPLTVSGLAELLDVSTDWVYTQVEGRTIPCTRLPGGRQIRFTDEHVAQILAEGAQPVITISAVGRKRLAKDPPPEPEPDPKPRPKDPVTPPPKGPASPRQPRGPRHNDRAVGGGQ